MKHTKKTATDFLYPWHTVLSQFQCPDHLFTWWLHPSWSWLSPSYSTALMKAAPNPPIAGWRVANLWPMTLVCCCHMTRRCWPSRAWWCQMMMCTAVGWRTPSAAWRACRSNSLSTVGDETPPLHMKHDSEDEKTIKHSHKSWNVMIM